jgi:fumarate hydratase class II
MEYRTESDSLGEVPVPAGVYYGAQTARALTNFPIGEERMPVRVIRALGLIKRCAAETHVAQGHMDPDLGQLIIQAAKEVAAGDLADHFPLPVWQTGSGTQTHMNANEVIACRANELAGMPRGGKTPVHPNDHVNLGQSSNDVIPTALHIAVAGRIMEDLLPALEVLLESLAGRRALFGEVVKIGRTHLMDAVPLTLGQEISGWEAQVAAGRDRVAGTLEGLYELALGGTAVGTGLNAPQDFAAETIRRLAAATGQPFRRAANAFMAQASCDALVAASGALRGLAVALIKIASDVRLLASGPRCGLGELRLPANEPGSSIMPGKINPTQAEALHMVCAQVIGHDAAIGVGGMSGHLQLNANQPLIAHCLLQQIGLLAAACRSFAERCIDRLQPRQDQISGHLDRSLMLVTALVPRVGYERAAAAAQKAFDEKLTLREAVLELQLMTPAEFDATVDPVAMTRPAALD